MIHAVVSLLALASFGAPQQPQDPVRIWATLTPSAVEVGTTATLELHLETSGEKPDLITMPELPPSLEVIRTGEYSQLRFSLPGGRRQLYRREIVLRATDPGSFEIPPITAEIKGTRYETNVLTLTVIDRAPSGAPGGGPASTQPAAGAAALLPMEGGSIARGPRDEVILRARLAPDTAYVGQQVSLYAQAWVSEDAQLRLRRAPEYHPPNAPGFWTHDLPGLARTGRRIIDARAYRVQEFQRAYFPLAPGEYTLPPARLVYEVRRSFLYATDDQDLATDSLRLVVLPFPEVGRPDDFDGAVGRFDITARLEPAVVPAGEAAALVVEIEGRGNINALPPPRIPELQGVDVYPPAEDASIGSTRDGVAGVKRFTWILVPREAGRIALPTIEYPYFDPDAKQYRVASAAPLTLEVLRGEEPEKPAAGATPTIRGLRMEPADARRLRWVRTPGFAILLSAPLLALIPLAMTRVRRRASPRRHAAIASRRRRQALLDELRHNADRSGAGFFLSLETLIRDEIGAIMGAAGPVRGGADALATALGERGVPAATTNALSRLITRIEAARYQPSPPGPDARRALVDEVERILDILARHLSPRRGGRTGKRRPSVPTAGLFALLVLPASNGHFQNGVELFHSGDFAAAASAFSEHIRDYPDDPSGWYNLGNAEYSAGNRGPAIRAWLRTLRLAPRDPDARHNLRLAGADPDLVRSATGRLPLSNDEVTLFAGIAALLGAAGFLGYTFTRRRVLARFGTVASATALIAIASSLIPTRTNAVAVALPAELPIHIAPDRRAETIQILVGGSPLRIHERRGDWLRVSTTETEGWAEDRFIGEF